MWLWVRRAVEVLAGSFTALSAVLTFFSDDWLKVALWSALVFISMLVYELLLRDLAERPKLRFGEPETFPIDWQIQTAKPPTTQYGSPPPIHSRSGRQVIAAAEVTRIRVPLTNRGGAAKSVFVRLMDIEPRIITRFPTPKLHLDRDYSNDQVTYDKSEGFPLVKEDTEHLDFMSISSRAFRTANDSVREYTTYLHSIGSSDATEMIDMPSGKYLVRLGAFAEARTAFAYYQLDVDKESGTMTMKSIRRKDDFPTR